MVFIINKNVNIEKMLLQKLYNYQ